MNGENPAASPAFQDDADTLRRQLSERQLAMIAMGGAIGVALFLGSSTAIALAGPAIILSYLAAAVVALMLAYAAAEMAVAEPVAGSFDRNAERYVSRWSSFAVHATYSIIQIIAIGAEVRHPPQSGWLDELGRLKGGWSNGLGVARCAP